MEKDNRGLFRESYLHFLIRSCQSVIALHVFVCQVESYSKGVPKIQELIGVLGGQAHPVSVHPYICPSDGTSVCPTVHPFI